MTNCYVVSGRAQDCDGVVEWVAHREGFMQEEWEWEVDMLTTDPDPEFPVTHGAEGETLWVHQPNEEGGGRLMEFSYCDGEHGRDRPRDRVYDHSAIAMNY